MKGLTMDSLRHHRSLIPLFVFVGVGCTACTYYVYRLATKCPDVAWTRAHNSEPWQAYKEKRYKFYDAGHDMKSIQKPPEF